MVGAAYALELARAERAQENARLQALRDHLIEGMLALPEVRLTGHPTERLPQHASFTLAGVEGESLLLNLDLLGIAASSGSACTTGDIEPSHVLSAMGVSASAARGALRLTLGHSVTADDIATTLQRMGEILPRLRALSTQPA